MVAPGDYWRNWDDADEAGAFHESWSVIAPSGESGTVTAAIWTLKTEPDGALTVSPSIWYNKPKGWHGYLEKGVWREL